MKNHDYHGDTCWGMLRGDDTSDNQTWLAGKCTIEMGGVHS